MAKYTTWRKCHINIPTFNWRFDIVFTNDPCSYARHIGWDDENTKHEGTTHAMALFFPEEMKSVLIFTPSAGPGTIAHESWHGIHRMFEQLGVRLDDGEAVAYHLGYLVDGITGFQKKKRRKK